MGEGKNPYLVEYSLSCRSKTLLPTFIYFSVCIIKVDIFLLAAFETATKNCVENRRKFDESANEF